MGTHIFVSHIHEEFPVASAVKSELELRLGKLVEVFLAEDIPLGQNWFDQIRIALKKADLILGLFSHASLSSPWVNIETGFGIMSGKPMIPLCCLGLHKSELPPVYGLYQAMEINAEEDVVNLLHRIAAKTAAGELLADKETEAKFVKSWITSANAGMSQSPLDTKPRNEDICVWIMGSDHELADEKIQLSYRVVDSLARAMIGHRIRIVMNQNRLLSYTGDKIVAEEIAEEDQFIKKFAMESARANQQARSPNPIIVLGSLRSRHGVRSLFKDAIGRIPNCAIVIGGVPKGRVTEEMDLANAAGIPVLPIQFTGGAAADMAPTFDPALESQINEIQNMARHTDRLGELVCETIQRQVQIMRSIN
jgi:TIR domain